MVEVSMRTVTIELNSRALVAVFAVLVVTLVLYGGGKSDSGFEGQESLNVE